MSGTAQLQRDAIAQDILCEVRTYSFLLHDSSKKPRRGVPSHAAAELRGPQPNFWGLFGVRFGRGRLSAARFAQAGRWVTTNAEPLFLAAADYGRCTPGLNPCEPCLAAASALSLCLRRRSLFLVAFALGLYLWAMLEMRPCAYMQPQQAAIAPVTTGLFTRSRNPTISPTGCCTRCRWTVMQWVVLCGATVAASKPLTHWEALCLFGTNDEHASRSFTYHPYDALTFPDKIEWL